MFSVAYYIAGVACVFGVLCNDDRVFHEVFCNNAVEDEQDAEGEDEEDGDGEDEEHR